MKNLNKAIFLDRDGVIIKAPTINNKPKSIKKLNELKLFITRLNDYLISARSWHNPGTID